MCFNGLWWSVNRSKPLYYDSRRFTLMKEHNPVAEPGGMRWIGWKSAIAMLLATATLCAQPAPPRIQVALLLDTSHSMDGSLPQIQAACWGAISKLKEAKRMGQGVRLEVALYQYGISNTPPGSAAFRLVLPFTVDFQLFSRKLTQLTSGEGNEYCGLVIQAASRDLQWSDEAGDLRQIMIAGNEAFDQGPVNYQDAASAAAHRGIVINSIFCGDPRAPEARQWQDAARLADGFSLVANPDSTDLIDTLTEKDSALIALGLAWEKTILPYLTDSGGGSGTQGKARSRFSGLDQLSAVQATIDLARSGFSHPQSDLVDAAAAGGLVLDSLRREDLPADMRSMNHSEMNSYILEKLQLRKELLGRINHLWLERESLLLKRENTPADKLPFGKELEAALLQQAMRRGFSIE